MPFSLLAAVTPYLSSIATFFGGLIFARNTDKSTETSKDIADKNTKTSKDIADNSTKTTKDIAKQQQSHQLKLAYLNIQAQKNLEDNRQQFQVSLEESRQQFQINLEASRQQFQERMSYLGFQQQLTLREFDQAFQLQLRELDYEHQQEMEDFRAKVNVAINQKNLDFQAWKTEQEMALQKELAQFNRDTQLSVAAYQRQTALQLPEINKIYENWPLKILPTQILNSHPNHLRIFISPPALDYDRFANLSDPKTHNFPKIEGFLGTRLLKLLNQHYPRNDALRPSQLLDGAWDSKRFAGSASIIALADSLESEPLMVLETKVTLNKYLSLQVAYKGIGQKEYFYDEVIPRFEYGDILITAAKARMGKTTADKQQIPVTPDDWEVLYEMLEVAHCIVAAWIADVHHLIYNNAPPLLPTILPELVKELPAFLLTDANSLLMRLMQEIVKGYQNVFQALESTERRYQVPGLFLELAQGLASLPDQSMMKEQTKESILAFLRTRNCTDLQVINHREQIENLLVSGDSEYFDKLEKFIASIGKENVIPEADNLLQVWCDLKPRREEQQSQNEQQSQSGISYCNIIAYPPNSSTLKPRQWLHQSSYEHCEGELQMGDNATIRCERCNTQMPIMDWFIIDDEHLSERDFGDGQRINSSLAMSFGGQLMVKKGVRWFKKMLKKLEGNETDQDKQPIRDDAEYHNLVVSSPASPQSKAIQWLHNSSYERCEGQLQMGDNGFIRCQGCHTQMPALEWCIVDNGHLSELEGKQMDTSDAISFAGQLVVTAGQPWMKRFLAHLE